MFHSIVFVHGFTGHPKDTWTFKAKTQSNSPAKKHGKDDDDLNDTARRSKFRRLQLFGRSPSASSSTGSPTPESSDTPTAEGAKGKDKAGQDVYWPADLANQTIPNSRIITYGYDTNFRHWLTGPVSKKTLYDHAWDLLCCLEASRGNPDESRRPIIFIVHSLGGIVVKEALRRARGCKSSKPHLHDIFEATASIIFFGTPHGGADPRNSFHHILSASVKIFGVQVNNQIVDTLMPNSERLTELRDEFPAMCQERNWLIYSFQEEYGLPALFGSRVVEDWSSCLNNPVLETRQFISSNHMDMCRFYGLQDPEYAKVAAAMKRILGMIERGSQDISRNAGEDHGISAVGDQDSLPPEVRDQRGNALVSIAEETKASLTKQLYFAKIDER